MPDHTIADAVRMVGHLLEHNGIVGPFAAGKNGAPAGVLDPHTCGWCMAGAADVVSVSLNVDLFDLRQALTSVRACHGSPVVLWELPTPNGDVGSTPEYRLALARDLQNYK